MAQKKEYINDIDWIRVFQRVPEITGLDLTLKGKAWEGRYHHGPMGGHTVTSGDRVQRAGRRV